MTHGARQVPANGGVSQQLQADLALPLPAVLDVLVAAQAVFAGGREGGREGGRAQGSTWCHREGEERTRPTHPPRRRQLTSVAPPPYRTL